MRRTVLTPGVVAWLVIGLGAAPAHAQIAFENVSLDAGFTHLGFSWGAAWADFDGDGDPDLWVTNHLDTPSLYRNEGDGTFVDLVPLTTHSDTHGAAWADFDNDGDQDLMQLAGGQSGAGSSPNLLLVNQGGLFSEEAVARGLDYIGGRGRTPLWVDWNRDGYLDVLVANLARQDLTFPTALFSQQSDGSFLDDSATSGFVSPGPSLFAQITGVSGTDLPLIITHDPSFPASAYLVDNQPPLIDLTSTLGFDPPIALGVQDSAIADFDGNMEPDLLLVSQVRKSDYLSVNDQTVKAFLTPQSDEYGLEFETAGNLNIQISPDLYLNVSQIKIGATGFSPPSHFFNVSATNTLFEGIAAHTAGVDTGFYVGRDPIAGTWQIFLSAAASVSQDIKVFSTATITAITPIGFTPSNGALPDKLFKRQSGTYVDVSFAAGVSASKPCHSVTTGDFDNDTDVDAYLVCRSMTGNLPNILLENDGSGVFTELPLAGGAAGATLGRGDTVVLADYDQDGFLDLFVTNGFDQGAFSRGPDQLFRNLGNANHWLEIDLEGVAANRDGIGARVILSAGGKLQMRERSGGMHRFAQDHARLHFGLGSSTVVDHLVVKWPDGTQQSINNIPADQLVRIVENRAPPIDNAPVITPNVDRGVYLWRDPANDVFQLRVTGDADPAEYTVRVVSAGPVTVIAAPLLEGTDVLTIGTAGFELVSGVTLDLDAVAFKAGGFTLLSVERDGIRDPRDLHIGPTAAATVPVGWIVNLDDLDEPPAFENGDLGLFLGRPGLANDIVARWTGDASTHAVNMKLLSSETISNATVIDLEVDDNYIAGQHVISIGGNVGADSDGADLTVATGSLLGVSFLQDNLFQYQRVNPQTRELGLANAFRIR